MNLICPKCGNKVNPETKRPQCGKCYFMFNKQDLSKFGVNSTNSTKKTQHQISDDLMSGSLVKALKKAGLDPMKNGQLRDAISTILEKDEYKIAWANALEKKKIDSIRLAKRVLISWLKEEKYL